MPFRAFIAAEISPSNELKALLADLGRIGPGLKPVEEENVHVTLKFLGDTDEALVQKIVACMGSAIEGIHPFTLTLKGTGYFPPRGPARTLWVGMEGAEPLATIATRLDKGLSELGFIPEERGFKAHLTVGRVKDNRAAFASEQAAQRYKDAAFGTQLVASIKLKRSVLGRFGPTYSDVAEVALH
ncbi:MAG: 2',5' RNA ligase family [Methanomassiliicoccales archaeon PtaU1.Bin124]|nr:MAG: 2',5' RNA ligase family [Methanomassiliicoccales archaeon PtaU1.Bin124]